MVVWSFDPNHMEWLGYISAQRPFFHEHGRCWGWSRLVRRAWFQFESRDIFPWTWLVLILILTKRNGSIIVRTKGHFSLNLVGHKLDLDKVERLGCWQTPLKFCLNLVSFQVDCDQVRGLGCQWARGPLLVELGQDPFDPNKVDANQVGINQHETSGWPLVVKTNS